MVILFSLTNILLWSITIVFTWIKCDNCFVLSVISSSNCVLGKLLYSKFGIWVFFYLSEASAEGRIAISMVITIPNTPLTITRPRLTIWEKNQCRSMTKIQIIVALASFVAMAEVGSSIVDVAINIFTLVYS